MPKKKTPKKRTTRTRSRKPARASGHRKKPATAVQHAPDTTLMVLLGILVVFGLVTLASASSVQGYQLFGDSYYYLKHQMLYGLVLGGTAFYIMSKIEYHYWRQYAFPIAVATIILLLIVFVPGIGVERLGAKRWIDLGGFSFQPSEVVKLSFIIYLAAWLEKRGREVEDVTYGFFAFLTMLGALVLLIAIAQKDLGTTIVIAVISVVMYFVAGAPWKHIAYIAAGGAVAVFTLIKIAPYRAARFTVFLDPAADPEGIGYHVNQALLAIGSGGLFGLGLGHSRQKFNYLPEVMSDSIYAIVAEEMGFVVAVALVLLYLALVYRSLQIAKRAPDAFGKYLAVGIVTWVGFQAFVNIGAMLSLVPLTGIPLPFVSYGSSSVIMLFAAMGLLVNISKKAQ
jgi:cell division protein FtsW